MFFICHCYQSISVQNINSPPEGNMLQNTVGSADSWKLQFINQDLA